jgi:hypothetical protein
MAEQIVDGTGTGYKLKVDPNNRGHVFSVSETIAEAAARQGDSYNINTGNIILTSANKSSILYLKNNGDVDLAILSIGFLMGNSTGGTGDVVVEVTKNPTAGTLISGALPVLIDENKNAGSSKSLNIDVFKGLEATTITNGTDWYYSTLAGSARAYVIATGSIIIPKGSSMSVSITPQTSNTSMNFSLFMSLIEDNF